MFWYFGYGSNMDLTSLRAKGVDPRASERAVLCGWRLRFNVHHFFELDAAYVDALRQHPVHQKRPVPPFVPPPGEYPTFTDVTLAQNPLLTALAGSVFDMSGARWQHRFLQGFFGGKDMTLFHLKRLDDTDGAETLDDIKHDRLTPAQREYLNEYLHEYSAEYVYFGRYRYK